MKFSQEINKIEADIFQRYIEKCDEVDMLKQRYNHAVDLLIIEDITATEHIHALECEKKALTEEVEEHLMILRGLRLRLLIVIFGIFVAIICKLFL